MDSGKEIFPVNTDESPENSESHKRLSCSEAEGTEIKSKTAERNEGSQPGHQKDTDEHSKTDTYPYNEIEDDTATVTHEAAVGKIGQDLIFYLMSRGITEQQALGMIVNGFFEVFTKELPMEYAVEFNRLIQLEMAGSVG